MKRGLLRPVTRIFCFVFWGAYMKEKVHRRISTARRVATQGECEEDVPLRSWTFCGQEGPIQVM